MNVHNASYENLVQVHISEDYIREATKINWEVDRSIYLNFMYLTSKIESVDIDVNNFYYSDDIIGSIISKTMEDDLGEVVKISTKNNVKTLVRIFRQVNIVCHNILFCFRLCICL